MKDFLREIFIQQARQYCVGKIWIWRLMLLLYLAYVLFRYITGLNYWSLFDSLNLAIHELGHVVFGFFGQLISVLGGTLLQCLAPIYAVYNFYQQRDFFAIALCFGWLSTNLFGIARYMGDARLQQLPLVSIGGGDVIHDWYFLFSRWGVLNYDILIAGLVYGLAILSMLCCFVYGGWLIREMIKK